jgi:hypothetical protein
MSEINMRGGFNRCPMPAHPNNAKKAADDHMRKLGLYLNRIAIFKGKALFLPDTEIGKNSHFTMKTGDQKIRYAMELSQATCGIVA